MENNSNKTIKSYRDLRAYQNLYKAMVLTLTKIVPNLPKEEKYIDDTIEECNEMINHLSVCIDVYSQYVDVELCKGLIDIYDMSSRQLYNLRKTWQDFHKDD